MFAHTGHAGARARYRALDISTKVEGASPHQLIGILFDEVMKTLDTLAAGIAAGNGPTSPGMPERRARAVSILLGLEGCLDHGQGGELAAGLAAIYREARRLLGEGLEKRDLAPLVQARDLIAEIAEAWGKIG
ncbi:flagellar export chaperone FliS [Sphingomonas morindae]|uniref:Flagellar protein FliS n=1 Tax=Sphingomonas morindae TaxID=1541170 RepID=A0ABY4X9Y4_9SPHN|nr:flagellar export chaperone FliS [Sphingomonas morindae]USI73709.1 flagellar protein FliS [Sphingomonas morindae]